MARKSTKKINKEVDVNEVDVVHAGGLLSDEQVEMFSKITKEDGVILVQNPFELNLTQTVGATGTVAHADKKDFGQIMLLRQVAGLKSGSIIDVTDVDTYGGVHFKVGDVETYLSTFEKGRLWKFHGEK